jgi:hypothetical protein
MSTYRIHSGHGAAVPLGLAKGKSLHSVEVYQNEDTLSMNLQFQDGLALELTFRVGFRASATLLRYANGDSEVIEKIRPTKRG